MEKGAPTTTGVQRWQDGHENSPACGTTTEREVEASPQSSGSRSGGGERRGSDRRSSGSRRSGKQEGERQQPSKAEWAVGIVCSVVVLLAVGYLFYRALAGPASPPSITLQAERILPAGAGYLVELRIRNEGGETAASLMIEGSLMQDTTAVEKSTATIDFVPAETERTGGLFFTKDPRRYRLELRPTGYDRP